jgi:hypothetical protein
VVAVGRIEVCYAFTGKLKMLLLIMSNRNMSCPVNEDIGGLKNWIREKTKLKAGTGLFVVYGGLLTKVEFTLDVR